MTTKLQRGDTGSAVTDLQNRLRRQGFTVAADGWFGEDTEAAVIAFQRKVGLVVDGIAGPKTITALDLLNSHGRLRQEDLVVAADTLGASLAAVMAVNAVESRGLGFIDDRPAILFERHVLHKLLAAAGAPVDELAQRYPALINTARGGYLGGAGEWARLNNARLVTADYPMLAEQACSWGAFQIMGYHWELLGYDSPAAFVAAMRESEARQLEAFVRFIQADPALHKALRGRKWAEFARIYNGPAYRENLYDAKLARAYDRFAAMHEPAGEAA